MIVYGASLSPFVRKVLAFAAEKGIEVEHKVLPPNSDDRAANVRSSRRSRTPSESAHACRRARG